MDEQPLPPKKGRDKKKKKPEEEMKSIEMTLGSDKAFLKSNRNFDNNANWKPLSFHHPISRWKYYFFV